MELISRQESQEKIKTDRNLELSLVLKKRRREWYGLNRIKELLGRMVLSSFHFRKDGNDADHKN